MVRLQVWYAHSIGESWEAYRDWLSADEQQRLERIRHTEVANTYLAAHVMQRHALSQFAGGNPGDWQFERDRFGKPHLVNHDGQLACNLSHTRGLVACVVAETGSVGIDVESFNRRCPLHLAPRVFTPDECRQLNKTPIEQRHRTFFRLWTLKEAVVKADGAGLTMSLQSFGFPDCHAVEPQVTFRNPTAATAHWQFWTPNVHPDYAVAVALQTPAPEPRSCLEVHEFRPPANKKTPAVNPA